MVIFHSYVSLPDGILRVLFLVFLKSVGENSATTNSRRKHKFARIEAKVCGIGNLYHRHRDVQFDSLTHFWHTKNCQSQQTVLDQYWHLASGMFVAPLKHRNAHGTRAGCLLGTVWGFPQKDSPRKTAQRRCVWRGMFYAALYISWTLELASKSRTRT